ncbi:UNVERIFIED_CONTAM: hypothetical protein H355_005460 [Colinus virginianus]|nr:hypothetical protein H355_005460 [Colinus virginianus]
MAVFYTVYYVVLSVCFAIFKLTVVTKPSLNCTYQQVDTQKQYKMLAPLALAS